jgi:hypothetical protein
MVEQRAALRFPTDLEADCRAPERAWASRLRNISTSGCMITLPDGELPADAPLRLRIRGLARIDAQVVWQHRSHAGVRFRVPLHPAAMEHLGFVLPEDAWESPLRSQPVARVPAPRRAMAVPSRRAGAPGLGGHLVKRVEVSSEHHD